MNTLSIDTTADICSISLKVGDSVSTFHETRPREHAKIVLPEIQRLCLEAGIAPSELHSVVFGKGPGSFTGVRIAAGVAQGLAFSAECLVLPVSTLQSIAYSAKQKANCEVWAALDARMHEIYFARFTVDDLGIPQLLDEEKVIPPSRIDLEPPENVVLVGNGWQTDYEVTDRIQELKKTHWCEPLLPHSADHIALAEALLTHQLAQEVPPEEAVPTYLRDKVTWDNKPKVGS